MAAVAQSCAHCGASLAGRTDARKFKGDSGTRLSRDLWITHLESDPFCSTACCRAAHSLVVENPDACLGCGQPLSYRRNGLAGPRCRECANIERYKRYFFTSGVCSHCGCDLADYTTGCWPCGDRRRRRERRAAERAGACSPVSQASARAAVAVPGASPLYAATDAAQAA